MLLCGLVIRKKKSKLKTKRRSSIARVDKEEKTTEYYNRLGAKWFPSFANPGHDSSWK